ncbi:hypothetical protein P4H82_27905 [Bacillus cereus]|nr:hypothetical protein [Bacillus cereus]MEB9190655.1 hypothetical protein [Bacillus cereus]
MGGTYAGAYSGNSGWGICICPDDGVNDFCSLHGRMKEIYVDGQYKTVDVNSAEYQLWKRQVKESYEGTDIYDW